MLANYLIGLREGMEAALVVGILVAYVVRSGRRELLSQVWAGVGGAIAVSVGLGAVLTLGPSRLTDRAEETVAGVLSILAVALVTWMVFWMARTARYLKAGLHARLDGALAAGGWGVLVVAFLAVAREGLETALFLWAAAGAAGATEATGSPLLGASLGLATAAVLGWAVYRGAVALNLGAFFRWTGLFLIAVAAGVLAYGVHELQEAGVLAWGTAPAFDGSGVISATSALGSLLKGLLNFTPTPTWGQAVAWVAYLVPTAVLYLRAVRMPATPTPASPTPAPTVPEAASARAPQSAAV
jgi:high-affinity iron transporter